MKESKVGLQQRKIRNGIRKQKVTQQKQMWKKLTTQYSRKLTIDELPAHAQTITTTTHSGESYWIPGNWNASEIEGKKFDNVIIDEVVRKNE